MGGIKTEHLMAGAALVGLGAATGGFGLLGTAAAEGAAGTAGALGAAETVGGAIGAGQTTAATTGLLAEEAAKEAAKKALYSKLATGFNTVGTIAGVGGNYMQMAQQNALLKTQEALDRDNAAVEKAEKDLDIAQKETEIQRNLVKTLATQNNNYGAMGVNPANGGNAAMVMENTIKKANNDSEYLKNVQSFNNKAFETSAFNRTAAYYSARKNNKATAGAQSVGNLLNFGTRLYDRWSV